MPEIMLIKFEEKIVKNTYINTSNDTCSNGTRHSQKNVLTKCLRLKSLAESCGHS